VSRPLGERVGRIGGMTFCFLYLAVRALLGALVRSRRVWVPETEIRAICGRVCGRGGLLSGDGVVAFRVRRDQTCRARCAAGRPRWGATRRADTRGSARRVGRGGGSHRLHSRRRSVSLRAAARRRREDAARVRGVACARCSAACRSRGRGGGDGVRGSAVGRGSAYPGASRECFERASGSKG
jgi:hypothetical protein